VQTAEKRSHPLAAVLRYPGHPASIPAAPLLFARTPIPRTREQTRNGAHTVQNPAACCGWCAWPSLLRYCVKERAQLTATDKNGVSLLYVAVLQQRFEQVRA
jgi:hypothetical protein